MANTKIYMTLTDEEEIKLNQLRRVLRVTKVNEIMRSALTDLYMKHLDQIRALPREGT